MAERIKDYVFRRLVEGARAEAICVEAREKFYPWKIVGRGYVMRLVKQWTRTRTATGEERGNG